MSESCLCSWMAQADADDNGSQVKLLRRAVERGVDHVDTAQFYGFGFVNDVIRETLRPEDDVLVVTKVGADPNPGGHPPLRQAQRPEQVAGQC